MPCVTRSDRRLRNSPARQARGLRQSSPTSPVASALLGGSEGEKCFDVCSRLNNASPRSVDLPLCRAGQRRIKAASGCLSLWLLSQVSFKAGMQEKVTSRRATPGLQAHKKKVQAPRPSGDTSPVCWIENNPAYQFVALGSFATEASAVDLSWRTRNRAGSGQRSDMKIRSRNSGACRDFGIRVFTLKMASR